MPQRSTPPISYNPIKLLKTDIRQDHNGTSVTMEFIDNDGTRLTTPDMPYPDNFDPMNADIIAERRGDEIRIKDSNGDVLMSVHAYSIEHENPIETQLDPNGYMCILPEEGEEDLPIRRFSIERGHPSEIGFAQAFASANRAMALEDIGIQEDLNTRYPDLAPPTIGASAWFRSLDGSTGGAYPYPAIPAHAVEMCETPKIKIDFDMKCISCEGKIHYPDKIIKLLGNEGTIKYFDFCKKNGSEPQMFCCACFDIMKNNPNIISAINKMNLKIKDMMNLTEREETVTKREKELDEQLKKAKKK